MRGKSVSCVVEDLSGICSAENSIRPEKVVRLRFWARDDDSRELLQFGDDLHYLHGGYGNMFAKVEAALETASCGDRVELSLKPEEGYGLRNEAGVITQPKHSIPEEAWEPGYVLMGALPDGREVPFTVTTVGEEEITLDSNHPWAGRNLHFTFEVMSIRESTAGERRMGYVLSA